MKAAERVFNIEHVFGVRQGIRRESENLPWRYFEEPCPDGPDKGRLVNREEWEKLKDEYYEERGWDKKTAIPSARKLRELGLDYLIEGLIEQGHFT
jgi:aldehyde:ferredoxin oxidoreductase